jgi:carboxypeptidase family protein
VQSQLERPPFFVARHRGVSKSRRTSSSIVDSFSHTIGGGDYGCANLPTNATYVVTPQKLGFSFTPTTRTEFVNQDLSSINFTGNAEPNRTISGRVTSSGGTGIGNVTMALSGSQTASSVTNANGDYSFSVLYGGDYTVTPSKTSFTFSPTNQSFTNVTTDQTANFTGTFFLQLVLDDGGQAAALNSSQFTRDPFPVIDSLNVLNSGVDRNTRISIFLANFQLEPNETPGSVVVRLVGSNNQSFEVPAEAVSPVSDPTFTQITFRLPDALTPGNCQVAVKARGATSNMGVIRINN